MTVMDVLQSLAKRSTDSEFYTPLPKGMSGKTKYVIVYGTVMSGLGKAYSWLPLQKSSKTRE